MDVNINRGLSLCSIQAPLHLQLPMATEGMSSVQRASPSIPIRSKATWLMKERRETSKIKALSRRGA